MTSQIEIPNAQIIPASNTFHELAHALPAGLVAYLVGEILATLRPLAVRLNAQRLAILEEYYVLDDAGNPTTAANAEGKPEFVLTDRHAAETRIRELWAGTTVVAVPRLTLKHLERIEEISLKDRVIPFEPILLFVDGETVQAA